MRQGHQNNRNNRQRSRGRRPNNGGGNPSNKVYDSNGPDVRVRGSAQTVADKYLQLAADAQSQGDQIKTESYFQYAEHYLRIVAANQALKAQKQAEKEKAAEEHAARMQAKKEKAAAELEKKARKSDNKPEKKTSETAGPANGSADSEKDDDWGGHQPAFLQRDEEKPVEKPKKPRRKPAKKKAEAVDVTTATDNDAAASESTSAG